MGNKKVAILYAREDSIYKNFEFCDVWDRERDAVGYPGGLPVVAHPPCRSWSRMRSFSKPLPGEKELALLAIDQVRRDGGVLEHPASSSLFLSGCLPLPGFKDDFGFTTCVDQFWFGHLARKRTWLYIVGVGASDLPAVNFVLGESSHVCCRTAKNKKSRPEISKKKREETPVDFAKWLIDIALISNKRS